MKREKYTEAEFELISFDANDIITTSDPSGDSSKMPENGIDGWEFDD